MKNYDILKAYCKKIFLIGNGNFWYDDNEIGDDKRLIYKTGGALLYFVYSFMTILEIMAAVMGDFPEDEKSDSVSFAVSHTIVMIKIYSVIVHKSLIKTLNHKMITVCQSYEEQSLMAEKYKIMKINVVAYVAIVYGSCACFIIEGLRKVYVGSHFVTVVTYYPIFEDDSAIATFVRVFTTLVLLVMMVTMIVSVDSFTMVYIIMYKYKFITLRHYFERLREEVERLHHSGDSNLVAEKVSSGLIEGIEMHSKILKLSKEIHEAFGTVMALQLCQSSGSAVSILLQIADAVVWVTMLIALTMRMVTITLGLHLLPSIRQSGVTLLSHDLKFVAAAKLIFFVIALFFLLGLFLCNAGEITHQASLVADAIFYCGWHLCPPRLNNMPRRNIRQLVVLALMQAQQPLVMKAFKMVELSYGTFLSVVRGTYSVFALFYAQNK